jgi:hypothetical protein
MATPNTAVLLTSLKRVNKNTSSMVNRTRQNVSCQSCYYNAHSTVSTHISIRLPITDDYPSSHYKSNTNLQQVLLYRHYLPSSETVRVQQDMLRDEETVPVHQGSNFNGPT